MSNTTMRLSTSGRQALRDHLTSEFHRWVEDLLSRDELPLVGSAVPAMTHPQPRRGSKTKAKIKTKTKTPKKTATKTSREEDKSSAPAAPAPEDQRPTPAASTPEEASREDGWKTAKSGKRRRRSQDTSQTESQPGKRPRATTTTPRSSTSSAARSRQCHNCQGFGHSTRSCTNQAICAQCSGTHHSIQCVDQRTIKTLQESTPTCAEGQAHPTPQGRWRRHGCHARHQRRSHPGRHHDLQRPSGIPASPGERRPQAGTTVDRGHRPRGHQPAPRRRQVRGHGHPTLPRRQGDCREAPVYRRCPPLLPSWQLWKPSASLPGPRPETSRPLRLRTSCPWRLPRRPPGAHLAHRRGAPDGSHAGEEPSRPPHGKHPLPEGPHRLDTTPTASRPQRPQPGASCLLLTCQIHLHLHPVILMVRSKFATSWLISEMLTKIYFTVGSSQMPCIILRNIIIIDRLLLPSTASSQLIVNHPRWLPLQIEVNAAHWTTSTRCRHPPRPSHNTAAWPSPRSCWTRRVTNCSSWTVERVTWRSAIVERVLPVGCQLVTLCTFNFGSWRPSRGCTTSSPVVWPTTSSCDRQGWDQMTFMLKTSAFIPAEQNNIRPL